MSIAWPFIMPTIYYDRRAKGLLLIFAFVGTYIVALAWEGHLSFARRLDKPNQRRVRDHAETNVRKLGNKFEQLVRPEMGL